MKDGSVPLKSQPRTSCLVTVAVALLIFGALAVPARADEKADHQKVVQIRAWGVPQSGAVSASAKADLRVMEAFRTKYPWIDPVSTTGITIPGGSNTMDMVPFMQIAGDIAPDALYVNFRQSDTYISMKLLFPLEKYIEGEIGANVPDSGAMSNDQYVEQLKRAPGWSKIESRIPPQIWPVVRRDCPMGDGCRYRKDAKLPPLERHRHVWCFPVGPMVMGIQYNRPVLAEHAAEGVEVRAPRDWDELYKWSVICTDPENQTYGLLADPAIYSWYMLSFLYSSGARVVEEQPDGKWKCVLDSPEATDAVYFFARLRWAEIKRRGELQAPGVLSSVPAPPARYAFTFSYLDDRFLAGAEDRTYGFGPVPLGPSGKRGSEFNSWMLGVFSGLADNPEKRDAAWHYIFFRDGEQARRIRTETLVDAGLGSFVRPYLLKQFNDNGRYESLIRNANTELEETYKVAFENGVPEPYGKNCQYVYNEMNKPISEALSNAEIRAAIEANNPEAAKGIIREIMRRGTDNINEKMIGILPPEVRRTRNWVAWTVIVLVTIAFVWTIQKTYQTFRPPVDVGGVGWQFHKFRWAYFLLVPALLSIGLWAYWPMVKGSAIAFQEYSVLGHSPYVGAANFAEVLYDGEFWHAMGISLIYGALFLFFGFWVPIGLAFLLNEVPKGKTLFRVIYYLPAVLSGLVVIVLWKQFYGGDGLINQVLNGFVYAINFVFGAHLGEFKESWLENPKAALMACLLPTVWAGMGPGCLIYLAALKTVPDETYEAADLDGAGVWGKLFHVALPSIKALISINFIGAMIGAIRGAGGFVLAMTGGGPYGTSGGATEVVGLKLFYTTFGALHFGQGAAMAWVLGAMLIGFTVLQLRKLSRMEFKTAVKA